MCQGSRGRKRSTNSVESSPSFKKVNSSSPLWVRWRDFLLADLVKRILFLTALRNRLKTSTRLSQKINRFQGGHYLTLYFCFRQEYNKGLVSPDRFVTHSWLYSPTNRLRTRTEKGWIYEVVQGWSYVCFSDTKAQRCSQGLLFG